ncbi:hypothetical protein GW7_13905, partial [Heterocephalus glaber]
LKMRLPTQLLGLLMLWIPGKKKQKMREKNEPLEILGASQVDFVSITCRSSIVVGVSKSWYKQKPKEPHRLLVCGASAPKSFFGSPF